MANFNKLRINMEKRIQTTMIGALDKLEKNFGKLWGHYKDAPLTEQEEEFAELWDITRNQILNQGNNQIRNIKDDFERHGQSNARYYYNLGKPTDERE
jgi:hypothetical protein